MSSSTFSAPPSQTTSPDSGAGANQGNSYSTTNATLYLYTFLATLVLLLAVSSAIVIRSLILRRRHQRLVEEAIRTGTWMPNRFDSTAGRRRRDIGQKPRLWEVWPHPASDDGEQEVDEKSKWHDVMPFYAAYVNPPSTSPQGPAPGSTENAANPSRSRPLHRFILRSFADRRSSPASAESMTTTIITTPTPTTTVVASSTAGLILSSSTVSPTAPTAPAPGSTPTMRVAVLIAMPSPPPSRKRVADAESGPPVVEIGVVEADVKDNEDAATTSTMPKSKLTRGTS